MTIDTDDGTTETWGDFSGDESAEAYFTICLQSNTQINPSEGRYVLEDEFQTGTNLRLVESETGTFTLPSSGNYTYSVWIDSDTSELYVTFYDAD